MSIETIQPFGSSTIAETTRVYEQPPGESDATTLSQPESNDLRGRDVSYLSSTAILAHERALLSDMQAELAALAEDIRQADIALARINIDFHYIDEQISDLGYTGVPQMNMQKDLEEAHQEVTANKASLVAQHSAKIEEIDALRAHQDRREWVMSEDY